MASDIVRIQVHKSLVEVMEDIRKEVSKSLKGQYSLSEIEVPRTLSSRILAERAKGKKEIQFKLKRVSINKGILEIIG